MFTPVNKYLAVRMILEQERDTGILVPDDYKEVASSFSLVEVVTPNSTSAYKVSQRLVVPTHMIETIELFGEKHQVVLENNVIAYFNN